MSTTPIDRLRELHRPCSVPCFTHSLLGDRAHCWQWGEPWPCDTIAALDALQEEIMCLSDGPSVDWWQHAVNELRQQAEALATALKTALFHADGSSKYAAKRLQHARAVLHDYEEATR